ncbi:unnamed protein product [Amoebophrya sp. A120]|nr:unnamed protein product [Amoebophrya sp. A120]|eukprot:GSA120T00025065001.1
MGKLNTASAAAVKNKSSGTLSGFITSSPRTSNIKGHQVPDESDDEDRSATSFFSALNKTRPFAEVKSSSSPTPALPLSSSAKKLRPGYWTADPDFNPLAHFRAPPVVSRDFRSQQLLADPRIDLGV